MEEVQERRDPVSRTGHGGVGEEGKMTKKQGFYLFLIVGVILMLCVVAVYSAHSQEAHVIALKSNDAAHARCTYERLQKAQKEWEEVKEQIQADYVTVEGKPGTIILAVPKQGFENGFQFSEDFKYIVPKLVGTTGTLQLSPGSWGEGCLCSYAGTSIGTACPCTTK